jgi:tRNA threonylcarbamoyladenosine biosynthesis protein TsaB
LTLENPPPVSSLLAIDTATDACSLALQLGSELRLSHEVIPRRHLQELFVRLESLLHGRPISTLGLDAVVCGIGPGSFTGLRIATSLAQGLAFSLRVPVIGLSTLEVQVHGLLRRETLPENCLVASTIDARIGETYAALFRREGGALSPVGVAQLARPEQLQLAIDERSAGLPLFATGSGDLCPPSGVRVEAWFRGACPEARDMLPLAEARLAAGDVMSAAQLRPDYVRTRSGWKTLAEQGRSA